MFVSPGCIHDWSSSPLHCGVHFVPVGLRKKHGVFRWLEGLAQLYAAGAAPTRIRAQWCVARYGC